MRRPCTYLVTLLAVLGNVAACGSDDSAGPLRCFPGETAPCVCPDGTLSTIHCDITGFARDCACVVPLGPEPPIADAGFDLTVHAADRVDLDGTGSHDPNLDALTYAWSFTSVPDGADPALDAADDATPSFVPGATGTFVLTLTVSDGEFVSDPDAVTVTATNTPPVANAGLERHVITGSEATLDGTASSDPDDDALTYRWRLTSSPEGSTASLTGSTSASPSIVSDVDGTYELELVVSDGIDDSPPALVTVASYRRIEMLAFRVLDAEYSDQLDSMVAVSESPSALHVYDAATGSDRVVDLPLAPSSVSVSPDGLFAAVGHNAYVSHVNLALGTVLATHPVTCDAVDVVLDGNGQAHVLPRVDQWVELHSVDLSTGQESIDTTGSLRAGTLAKLHPSGTKMYGANNGLSPSDIERYDIVNDAATFAYDSPYHGDYPMCGDIWISRDGARIFTKCGSIFRTSDVQAEDMTFNGNVEGVELIRHLWHSSVSSSVLVIPDEGYSSSGEVAADRVVRIHNDDFLGFERELGLPSFLVGDGAFAGHGRFVFSNAAGTSFFVVLQADGASTLLEDYGVVTYEL